MEKEIRDAFLVQFKYFVLRYVYVFKGFGQLQWVS
jgi:hypothetical protein